MSKWYILLLLTIDVEPCFMIILPILIPGDTFIKPAVLAFNIGNVDMTYDVIIPRHQGTNQKPRAGCER